MHRLSRQVRYLLFTLGCVLILGFVASIVDSLIFGPRCPQCFHPWRIIISREDEWIRKTIWKCPNCGKTRVDHFYKQGIDVNPEERN